MAGSRTVRVAAFGLSGQEQRFLESLWRRSAARARAYEFTDPRTQPADVALVNGDDPIAVAEWELARSRRDAPAVVLTSDGRALAGQRALKRPIIPSRLLSLLDEIPLSQSEAKPGSRADQPAAARPRFVALVVDDSPTVRKHIKLALEPHGIAAEFAETGEEALEHVATTAYDIIFLDVVLPGTDGYQVCKAIKKDPARKHIPVVMLTGKDSTFDRIKGSLAGCDTYLTKPVRLSVFEETLTKYLGDIENREVRPGPNLRPATSH